MEQDLTIIPVINKIDLPVARREQVARELVEVIGFAPEEIQYVSAKTGEGVTDLLETIVERVPPPNGDPQAPARALIFDSEYSSYKGVVAYVRVVDGALGGSTPLLLMTDHRRLEPLELGTFRPQLRPTTTLECGAVGYVATGLKEVADVRVGDTITTWAKPAQSRLLGYLEAKSVVFAGPLPVQLRRLSRTGRRAIQAAPQRFLTPLSTRRAPWRWVSASAWASWVCCTWRSSRSVWSGSTDWR